MEWKKWQIERGLREFGLKKVWGRRDSLFYMCKFLAPEGQGEVKMMEPDLSHWPPATQGEAMGMSWNMGNSTSKFSLKRVQPLQCESPSLEISKLTEHILEQLAPANFFFCILYTLRIKFYLFTKLGSHRFQVFFLIVLVKSTLKWLTLMQTYQRIWLQPGKTYSL